MNKTELPDIEKVKSVINEWVKQYPRISKVYLFGSYVKRDKPVIEDIDIAIEISNGSKNTSLLFWIDETQKMDKELTKLLNYKVDLDWFDGENNRTIKKGLDEGNILIFERH